MDKALFFAFLFFSNFVLNTTTWASGSCTVSTRKTWCRDMTVTPSVTREVEINGCSVTCGESYRPVCAPGELMGRNCTDSIQPSQCYCI